MTVFWKTDRIDTNTEIHFLPVDKSHTHVLFRDTKHLRLDGRVCFYRRLFSDAVKPRGCLSWPLWPLRGIYKTAWGAKLILTAALAYPVSCAGLDHLLMAKHCPLSLIVCFTPPMAPHPPTPPPSHPSTLELGNIMILSYIGILNCHDNRYRREFFSIVISPMQYYH